MSGDKYYVTTWDSENREFTPQCGVRTGPYSKFGLKKPLRKLRAMGYDISRQGGTSVLVVNHTNSNDGREIF